MVKKNDDVEVEYDEIDKELEDEDTSKDLELEEEGAVEIEEENSDIEIENEESQDNWNLKKALEEKREPWGTCPICGKLLYSKNDLKVWYERRIVRNGRASHGTRVEVKGCNDCLQEKVEKEKQAIATREANDKAKANKKLVWALIAFFCILGISIVLAFTQGYLVALSGIFIGSLALNLILSNTFIEEMFFTMASWSLKAPGVIWEFSLDGFLFLIAVKILFWLLGVILGILVFIFAVIVCSAISPFVVPLSLYRNIKKHQVDVI